MPIDMSTRLLWKVFLAKGMPTVYPQIDHFDF